MNIDRKEFLVWFSAGAATLLVRGCGGGGSSSPQAAAGCTADISANHGHVLSLPAADLDALTPRTYDIQGGATHTHSVTFSAAQLAQLKAGAMVTVTTSVADAHQHTITEACV